MATLAEKEIQLAEIKAAITSITSGGQSYIITSASGGGTSRTFVGADIDELYAIQKQLENEIAIIEGYGAVKVRPAW